MGKDINLDLLKKKEIGKNVYKTKSESKEESCKWGQEELVNADAPLHVTGSVANASIWRQT